MNRAGQIQQRACPATSRLMAEQALASGSPANNPKVPTKADSEALYELAFA